MVELNLHFLKNLTVLYVEDDAIVASQTMALLKHFFRKVLHCDNAEDALLLHRSNPIHILITDIELPGRSGLELCEEIRKTDRHIPIFITTMHDDKANLQKAIKLNLVDYLIKPVSISTIEKSLIESLSRLKENGILLVKLDEYTTYFPLSGELQRSGIPIPMTCKEIELLDLLLARKNQVVERETIEYHLYPDEPLSDSAYKNLIYRLRKKIGKESIVSISGIGIKLNITD